MKKLMVVFVAILAAIVTCNAQYYLGGSVGFGSGGGKVEGDGFSNNKTKTSHFNFNPMVGYELSDKLSVGLRISLNTSKNKFLASDLGALGDLLPDGLLEELMGDSFGGDQDTKFNSWKMGVFGRYKAFEMGKFALIADAELGFGGGSSKYGSTQIGKNSTFGLNVAPVLSYSLAEKLSIETTLNVLSFGFNLNTDKDPDDNKYKDVTSDFGFGVNTGSYSGFSAVKVGFVYKF